MATIVYLDADDEITSAASRIRAADDARVGPVLPFGSRVATSRINFRLLAREALVTGRRLDIVAPDAAARALAASAGLAVFGSVGEYESALDAVDDADDPTVDLRAAGLGGAAATGAATGAAPTGLPAGDGRPIDPSRDTASRASSRKLMRDVATREPNGSTSPTRASSAARIRDAAEVISSSASR